MPVREGWWWGLLIAGLVGVAGYAAYQVSTRDSGTPLPPATFLERSGRTVTLKDWRGRVSIVGFFFSCCQASCPMICQAMQELQSQLRGTDVRLILISVDPETDRPQRLREVAESLRADPQRWWFLTQIEPDSDRLFSWIEEGFGPAARPKPLSWYHAPLRGWDIAHSNRLYLLDRRGRIRDSELVVIRLEERGSSLFVVDEEAVRRLAQKARQLAGSSWFNVRWLPTVNVALNMASLLLITAGFVAIKTRRVRLHRALMLCAAGASGLFLLSYLYYHWEVGHVRYPGEGWDRGVYLTILVSHVVLAAGLAVLVPIVLWWAMRRRWSKHRLLARITLPIWIYVCLSGVAVYVMLYLLHSP
jgi:uncharacterized membrane protein YozB (DUF420 family)/cytochrome oxidase Cu insertion factor (SCO1/SenC/PrrC family)